MLHFKGCIRAAGRRSRVDDRELDGLMGVFEELLSDADVELEK